MSYGGFDKDADDETDDEYEIQFEATIEDWEKWATDQEDAPDNSRISLLTLAYMHSIMKTPAWSPLATAMHKVLKFITVLTLLAVQAVQVVLPLFLLHNHWYKVHQEDPDQAFKGYSQCPATAGHMEKGTMMGIGILYFSRMLFRSMVQYTNSFRGEYDPSNPSNIVAHELDRGSLGLLLLLDTVVENVWEGAVFAINISIIYTTKDIQEMIANAFYMEFITQFDDVLVAQYFRMYGVNAQAYKEASSVPHKMCPSVIRVTNRRFLKLISALSIVLFPLFFGALVPAISLCKA